MTADRIKKTKVFERNFYANAIKSNSILNQSTIRVCIDGSNLDGILGAGFYAKYPNNSAKEKFFCRKMHILAISASGKGSAFGKMHNQSIAESVDLQAAVSPKHSKDALKHQLQCSTALQI